MITQNSLSRKQHSSENRQGWIILGFAWKPHRLTLYPAGSQLSSGASQLWLKFMCVTWEGGARETETDRKGESASTPVLMWGVSSSDKLLQLLSGSGGGLQGPLPSLTRRLWWRGQHSGLLPGTFHSMQFQCCGGVGGTKGGSTGFGKWWFLKEGAWLHL